MKKNIKTILAGIFCSIAIIGTVKAERFCGYFSSGNVAKGTYGNLTVIKEDFEAGVNVTGKCCASFPCEGGWDNTKLIGIKFSNAHKQKMWYQYDNGVILIEGDIKYNDDTSKINPYILNPKFIYEY